MFSRFRLLVLPVAILVVLALVAGGAGAAGKPPVIDVVVVDPTPVALPSAPFTEEVSILSIDVSCNVPGDEEWRSLYGSNWQTTANAAIESADNAMYSNFDINLWSASYVTWDSNDSQMDITKLLTEAKSEKGLNGKKLMIAFTAQVSNCGASIVGGRYAIAADSWAEAQIVQHEISHSYGATHGACAGGTCVIADCVAHFGKWCSNCWTTIYNNRNSK